MKKTNLSWVGALLVFALLLWCTAATPGTIADPASYAPAVYSSMLSLLPPVVAIVLALNTKESTPPCWWALPPARCSLPTATWSWRSTPCFSTRTAAWLPSSLTAARGHSGFSGDAGHSGGLMNKGRRQRRLWPLGFHPHPHPGRGAVCHPDSGYAHFCGRLLQLPDRWLCDAPRDRPAEGLPRKAGYLIDSTAAPICIIAPVSSWAAAVTSSVPEAPASTALPCSCAPSPITITPC